MKLAICTAKFTPARKAMLKLVEGVIEEYEAMGYSLTLRQLYYQLVAKDLIPNTLRDYKNLGNLLNTARWAGEVSWTALEDRTRNVVRRPAWQEPSQLLRACADQYHERHIHEQPTYIEVWVEKDALIGVVERSVFPYDVPCMACRGYLSASEAFSAVERFQFARGEGCRRIVVLHLGDHDPSGIDMTRDLEARLNELANHETYGWGPALDVEVDRIALNMDQIRRYNPPPNPAKLTDSRAGAYVDEHGYSSWELDALRPDVIDALIREELERRLDAGVRERALRRIQARRDGLAELARTHGRDLGLLTGDEE